MGRFSALHCLQCSRHRVVGIKLPKSEALLDLGTLILEGFMGCGGKAMELKSGASLEGFPACCDQASKVTIGASLQGLVFSNGLDVYSHKLPGVFKTFKPAARCFVVGRQRK